MSTILTRTLIFAFIAAAVIAMISVARPQDADEGQIEFLLYCAGCHGTDAKGLGPQSAKLDTKPADLTILAKRNHGAFDAGAVYQMIDGRNGRINHHSAEMPIWGCRHQATSSSSCNHQAKTENSKKNFVADETAGYRT
jgi:mono/diheme cytochrome c family protein